MLLQNDEDVDIGFNVSTIPGHGTEDTCPKYVSCSTKQEPFFFAFV